LDAQGSKPAAGAFKEVVVFVARPHANDGWDGVIVDPSLELTGKEGAGDKEIRRSVQHAVVIFENWCWESRLQGTGFADGAEHDVTYGRQRV
jgi:hypothetical protein